MAVDEVNPEELEIDAPCPFIRRMDEDPCPFLKDLLVAHVPAVLDCQQRGMAASLLRDPTLEPLVRADDRPEVVLASARPNMRPGPEQSAVMIMIGREIIR